MPKHQKYTQNTENTVDIIAINIIAKVQYYLKISIYKLVTMTLRILFCRSQSNFITYLFGRGLFDMD